MKNNNFDGIAPHRPKMYHNGEPYIYENIREEIAEALKYNAPRLLNDNGNIARILFNGFMIILNPNGSYIVEDTAGG